MDPRFEKLKRELFMHGDSAICNFLGYEPPCDEEKDVTDARMDEVYDQMPEEELEKFYQKYAIL